MPEAARFRHFFVGNSLFSPASGGICPPAAAGRSCHSSRPTPARRVEKLPGCVQQHSFGEKISLQMRGLRPAAAHSPQRARLARLQAEKCFWPGTRPGQKRILYFSRLRARTLRGWPFCKAGWLTGGRNCGILGAEAGGQPGWVGKAGLWKRHRPGWRLGRLDTGRRVWYSKGAKGHCRKRLARLGYYLIIETVTWPSGGFCL